MHNNGQYVLVHPRNRKQVINSKYQFSLGNLSQLCWVQKAALRMGKKHQSSWNQSFNFVGLEAIIVRDLKTFPTNSNRALPKQEMCLASRRNVLQFLFCPTRGAIFCWYLAQGRNCESTATSKHLQNYIKKCNMQQDIIEQNLSERPSKTCTRNNTLESFQFLVWLSKFICNCHTVSVPILPGNSTPWKLIHF